ncbi:MAG: hypothetical protein MJ070_09045 [Lachnospiraceae bacterium]|nr:hypothetical protein [Lachnospiraceae bacterium]
MHGWLLRTPGNGQGVAAAAGGSGSVSYDGGIVSACYASIRPALWISIG